jgi:putative transposase
MTNQINYRPNLEPNQYYHCVNHAVGKELLFREEANYHFFLERYKKYIAPITITYAYCLMPNHFHFLIRIRSKEAIQRHFKKLKPNKVITDWDLFEYHPFLSQQFSNFFNSFAKAYNKRYERRGALFEDYFKRPSINGENHFLNTLRYIHQNPVKHGFVGDLNEWDFSSYPAYFNPKKNGTYKKEVLSYFETLEEYESFHTNYNNDEAFLDV